MSDYSRFGIFYLPPNGALAAFGAQWLGWDVETGTPRDLPDVAEIDDITMTPRKYGFHGTLKPPFVLAAGTDLDGLKSALTTLCATQEPVSVQGLELAQLGRFMALVPFGDTADLAALAARLVQELDRFRAPASEAELARRRKANLSPAQEAHLLKWGYPYVLDQFKFHLTLTGKLSKQQARIASEALQRLLPDLPQPFEIKEVGLVGERPDGRFETIQRYTLSG
ncbi:DUF1045 domain-containing protein [Tropicibacter sp. R15_0]|uniref:DUF1045 domain-containing protein n=1 Tax=Tropicibacter sp. R15_0 TaxID=2821101 RepID=UPI001ADAB5DA|nr:DUF1045 domain-containing protein [Tropicibacter sp. R15_0]MBO9465265.1 DUF1045 domain-containing protein [Tropicibacter sp. R15_0]